MKLSGPIGNASLRSHVIPDNCAKRRDESRSCRQECPHHSRLVQLLSRNRRDRTLACPEVDGGTSGRKKPPERRLQPGLAAPQPVLQWLTVAGFSHACGFWRRGGPLKTPGAGPVGLSSWGFTRTSLL